MFKIDPIELTLIGQGSKHPGMLPGNKPPHVYDAGLAVHEPYSEPIASYRLNLAYAPRSLWGYRRFFSGGTIFVGGWLI